ncbi:MAG: GNAT family N-acetyltransferase [Promethearchaeia archaeon]
MISSYFNANQPEFRNTHILERSEVQFASNIFARAFMNNPITVYTIPNKNRRKKKAKYMFEYLLRYGVKYGLVMSPSHELEGIAIWLSSAYTKETLNQQLRSGVLKVIWKLGLKFVKKQLKLGKVIKQVKQESLTDVKEDYIYLYSFCVDPKYQGRGYAGKLLGNMIEFSERTGVPIYLETAHEENISLYEHFKFEIKGKKLIPDSDYVMYGMLRTNRK